MILESFRSSDLQIMNRLDRASILKWQDGTGRPKGVPKSVDETHPRSLWVDCWPFFKHVYECVLSFSILFRYPMKNVYQILKRLNWLYQNINQICNGINFVKFCLNMNTKQFLLMKTFCFYEKSQWNFFVCNGNYVPKTEMVMWIKECHMSLSFYCRVKFFVYKDNDNHWAAWQRINK